MLEVMMAVVLLATIFMGIVCCTPTLFQAQRLAEQQELATVLGLSLMGQERAREFSALESTSGRSGVYQYGVEVRPRAWDLKSVTVTVRWNQQGSLRSVVLETLIYAGGGEVGRL